MSSDEEIHHLPAVKGLSDGFKAALLTTLDGDPEQLAHDAGLSSVKSSRRSSMPSTVATSIGAGLRVLCRCDRGRQPTGPILDPT